jgi:hypothetical protein
VVRAPGSRSVKIVYIIWNRFMRISKLMYGLISGVMMFPMIGIGGRSKLIISCNFLYRKSMFKLRKKAASVCISRKRKQAAFLMLSFRDINKRTQ